MDYFKCKIGIKNMWMKGKYKNEDIIIGNNFGAYTEDMVKIYKLYFKNFSMLNTSWNTNFPNTINRNGEKSDIPNDIENNIKNFFRYFGNVVDVAVTTTDRNVQGFVTFEKSESALSAILFNHDIQGIKMQYNDNNSNQLPIVINVFQPLATRKFTYEQARKLFGIFDENVQIDFQSRENSASKCLQIGFNTIESARKTFNYFEDPGSIICANSWDQPHQIKYKELSNYNDLSIFKLNDYCLREIFEYLSFKDLIRVLQVSQHFKKVLPSNIKITPVTVKGLTLMEILLLINDFSNKIVYIHLDEKMMRYDCNSLLKEIFQNCTALKELKLINLKLNKEFTYSIKDCIKSKNIDRMIIQNCDIADDQIICLGNYLNLNELQLNNNNISIEKNLNQCPNIISLRLELLDDSKLYQYEEIMKNFINLSELAVYIPQENTSNIFFDLIRKHCKNVKTLVITNTSLAEIAKSIGEMESLTNLTINDYDTSFVDITNIDQFMNNISKSSLRKQLEILTVEGNSSDVIPISFMRSINKLERLRILRLSFFKITNFEVIGEIFRNTVSLREAFLNHIDIEYDCILYLIKLLNDEHNILHFEFKTLTLIKQADYTKLLRNPDFKASQNNSKFHWKFNEFSACYQMSLIYGN